MRKKIVCIMLTVIVALALMLALVACNGNAISSDFELPEGGKPTLDNRITAEQQAVIDAGLNGSDKELQDAILTLYTVANESRFEKINSLMLQESVMGINPGGGANMQMETSLAQVLMHGFTLTTPKTYYNQFAAEAHTDNPIGSLVGAFSTMAKISYKTEDDKYFFVSMADDALECDTDVAGFPYATFKLLQQPEEYAYEDFLKETHTLNGIGEIYNLDYTTSELFDASKSTIKYENGLYSVHFEIDMSLDSKVLENWYRLPQEDMQVSGNSIDYYHHFYCDFEVWDNGYVHSYYADYARQAGMASSVTTDKFNYIYNDDEIKDILMTDINLDGYLELEKREIVDNFDEFNERYINQDTVKAGLTMFDIILIVAGCVVGVIVILIIVLIILNALRKAGHMPKWQERIDRRKYAKRERLIKRHGAGGTEYVVKHVDYDDYEF